MKVDLSFLWLPGVETQIVLVVSGKDAIKSEDTQFSIQSTDKS